MRQQVALLLLAASLASQADSALTRRVGEFEVTSTVAELLDEASVRAFEQIIPSDQPIEWAVYVPESYDPNQPVGVLVFISAGDSGKIPKEWKALMGRRNLIWIGANRSGNRIATSLRVANATLAPLVVDKSYELDTDRVYVSGFSGGGRVSSMVATEYAHLFKGAIYICGANLWTGDQPRRYDEVKKNRYAFITGTRDFNLRDTTRVYHAYDRAGIPNIKLMVIPGLSHRKPPVGKLEEAIEFLVSAAVD